jgi:hypothetical protein
LFFLFVLGEDDSKPGAVTGLEKHPVETILDVVLGQVHRAVAGVGVPHLSQDSMQGAAELHGFRRGVRQCGIVHGTPGVIAQESGLALSFFLDRGWRKLELRQGAHQAVRQDDPESALNELGHFLSEEFGVLLGRAMATPFNVGVFGGVGPGLGRGLCWDAVVSPLT